MSLSDLIRKKRDFPENTKPLATVATIATHALEAVPLLDSGNAASVATTRYSLLRFDNDNPTVAMCSNDLLQKNADFKAPDTCNNNDLASTVAIVASVAVANQNHEEIGLRETRRYCRQCVNFSSLNRYCLERKARQIDDIPRHCDDYTDNGLPAPTTDIRYPAETATPAEAGANTYPKPVMCWTPLGNPIGVMATDTDHEAFLLQANPKPNAVIKTTIDL
jgi:hypothetical protein